MKNSTSSFFQDTTVFSYGDWVELEGAGWQRIAAVEDSHEVWLENLDRSVAICELSPILLPENKTLRHLISDAKIEVHYIHELQHLLHLISDEALKVSCVELIENFSRNEIDATLPQ